MQNSKAVDVYKHTQVGTADPLGLVIMAYDSAIEGLRSAVTLMREGKYEEKAREIHRSTALVTELLAALDMERGSEIADALFSIYGYVLRRLTEADIRKDEGIFQEIIEILSALRDGWKELRARGEKRFRPSVARGLSEGYFLATL